MSLRLDYDYIFMCQAVQELQKYPHVFRVCSVVTHSPHYEELSLQGSNGWEVLLRVNSQVFVTVAEQGYPPVVYEKVDNTTPTEVFHKLLQEL